MNVFPARYPGKCLCGASFAVGAKIYWDGSVRRATGCPACASRKAVKGTPHQLPSGLVVRFDTHPDTGEVVLCAISDPCGAWNAVEVYALVNGEWRLRSIGREPVMSGPVSHAQIEGWRAAALAAASEGRRSTEPPLSDRDYQLRDGRA